MGNTAAAVVNSMVAVAGSTLPFSGTRPVGASNRSMAPLQPSAQTKQNTASS
jgi:hypothetical protein